MMQIIMTLLGYAVLIFAVIKGCSLGYGHWKESIYSIPGNTNMVYLLIYCGTFSFLIWLAVMLPIYLLFKIWWLALIVGGIIFFIYKKSKEDEN